MPKKYKNNSMLRHLGFFLLLFATLGLAVGLVSFGPMLSSSSVYAQDEEDGGGGGDEVDAQLDAGGDEGVPAKDDAVQESYLFWYINALGPLFAPAFAILSVVFVMLVVMNWMSINRNNIMPDAMVEQFRGLLEEKNYQEAYEVAKASESPQGKILAAGLAKMSAGYEDAQQSMNDVAEEEIMLLEQKLGYIGTVAGIGPMLGLLGTVFGMVASFQVIARSGTAPQASELAAGISTALITTQVGLLIAIPATIIYEVFRNKLARLVLELTVQTENLMGRFKTGG